MPLGSMCANEKMAKMTCGIVEGDKQVGCVQLHSRQKKMYVLAVTAQVTCPEFVCASRPFEIHTTDPIHI